MTIIIDGKMIDAISFFTHSRRRRRIFVMRRFRVPFCLSLTLGALEIWCLAAKPYEETSAHRYRMLGRRVEKYFPRFATTTSIATVESSAEEATTFRKVTPKIGWKKLKKREEIPVVETGANDENSAPSDTDARTKLPTNGLLLTRTFDQRQIHKNPVNDSRDAAKIENENAVATLATTTTTTKTGFEDVEISKPDCGKYEGSPDDIFEPIEREPGPATATSPSPRRTTEYVMDENGEFFAKKSKEGGKRNGKGEKRMPGANSGPEEARAVPAYPAPTENAATAEDEEENDERRLEEMKNRYRYGKIRNEPPRRYAYSASIGRPWKATIRKEEGGGRVSGHRTVTGGKKDRERYEDEGEYEKGRKGWKDEEEKKKGVREAKGRKEKREEEAERYEEKRLEAEGEKAAEFGETGKRKKGRSTKGNRSVHNLKEYAKKKEFYDEYHKGGKREKHGRYREERESEEGGKGKRGRGGKEYDEKRGGKRGKFKKAKMGEGREGREGREKHYSKEEYYDEEGPVRGEKERWKYAEGE